MTTKLVSTPDNAQTRWIVSLIAEGLDEQPETVAYLQIEESVRVFGVHKILGLAQRALAIHQEGSMFTIDGSQQKRTLGGVFFVLVKSRCSKWQYEQIFGQSRKVPVTRHKENLTRVPVLKSVLARAHQKSR